jgi:hypothetical protein
MATLSRARSAGKSSGAPNLLARCMELVEGHAHAALLLMRILFWMPRATVRHGGYTFVAKSREEWAVEAGISFDQCKRAMAVLCSLGLVATEQHKFGGRNITHVRVTGRALALLPAAAERCTSAPLSTRRYDRERQQGEDGVLAHAGGLGTDSSRDSGRKNSAQPQSGLHPAEPGKPCKAEAKFSTEGGVNPDSIAALEEIWQSGVAESYGGFVPSWTSKERGQMGHFRKVCPPDAAVPVLEACLGDWALFAAMAKSDAGAWNLPSRPTVGFLVKYAGVAVNLWQAKTKPKVPPTPKLKPQQTSAPSVEKPAPGEEKVSLEMVMAALSEPIAGGPPADN